MTTIPAALVPAHPHLRAAAIIALAAMGLFAHALAHPFAPAVIHRRTGRVRPR